MTKKGDFDYLRVLLDRLSQNRVVSIFGDSTVGRQVVGAPVFGIPLRLPTGAPAIARRSGCALLTVYTEYSAPQRYRVVIDPPVTIDTEQSRSQIVNEAIKEFARRLETHIIESPASWRQWPAGRRGPLA